MLAPLTYTLSPLVERTIEFKGLNRKPVIDDGEMRDMHNMSSDKYPFLTPRRPRGLFSTAFDNVIDMISKDGVMAVIDKKENGDIRFYWNVTAENPSGEYVPGLALTEDTYMVDINTKICFFSKNHEPGSNVKLWFDTYKYTLRNLPNADPYLGNIEHYAAGTGVSLKITKGTDANGNGVETLEVTVDPGGNIDFRGFREGDAVQLVAPGTLFKSLNVSAVIQSVNAEGTAVTFPGETFLDAFATDTDDDPSSTDTLRVKTYSGVDFTVQRTCPELDIVIEYNNRLWGVSNADNTIYACKLGDPLQWMYFQNTTLDSYYAEQGTDGDWTGAAAFSNHLLFFKENHIHKLYGSKPSEYQISTAKCYALEEGSEKSVCIANDIVFYKSAIGIMAYTGGTPSLVSDVFGDEKYKNVVAGSDDLKYYICATNSSGGRDVFVYDLEHGFWYKEDNVDITGFCLYGNKLVYISNGNLYYMNGAPGDAAETDAQIGWHAEFGPFDEYVEERKIYSKLRMRLEMETDSQIIVKTKHDNGEWITVYTQIADTETSIEIPVSVRRCNRFSVRIEGTGRVRILSLTRLFRGSTMRRDVM